MLVSNQQFITCIVILFVIRWSLDERVVTWLADLRAKSENEPDPIDVGFRSADENTDADEHVEQSYSRSFDDYDARMERMRRELDMCTSAGTDAIERDGVHNIPHDAVVVEDDVNPAVEEEAEIGFPEVAK